VRGDVPADKYESTIGEWCSPRARGCTGNGDAMTFIDFVFPACAGMYRVRNRP